MAGEHDGGVSLQTMEARRSRKHEHDGGCVSLPEDIILEVLVRVPANALCRFRCVSKAWRALISDPAFVAAQRSHAGRLIVGVFGTWPDYELRMLDMHGNVLWIFENVDNAFVEPTRMDIICVNRGWRGAMIVNPAARRAFTIGRHDRWSDFSFGRASQSGAYKVLRISQARRTACDVATITDDGAEPTWRRRPMPDWFNFFSSRHKATVNGVLYFFMLYNIYERTPVSNRIFAFDTERELWMETIDGPPLGLEVVEDEWSIALTELKGSLCMVHSSIQYIDDLGGLRLCTDVWCLIDYNRSVWVKAYKIQMPAEFSRIQVLDVLDDDRILLLSLNSSRNRYVLQFFNPSTEAFTDIMEMAEGLNGTATFYTGSLLCS